MDDNHYHLKNSTHVTISQTYRYTTGGARRSQNAHVTCAAHYIIRAERSCSSPVNVMHEPSSSPLLFSQWRAPPTRMHFAQTALILMQMRDATKSAENGLLPLDNGTQKGRTPS